MVKKAERKKRRSRKDVASSVETKNPELVFGIVGPIGVDIDSVIKALEDALRGVDYEPLTIHPTSEMDHPRVPTRIDHSSYYARYMSLIKKANEYRRKAKNPAALAGLAILNIRGRRQEMTKDQTVPRLGAAYIVRQFKRPEEIELMRRAYGRKFIQISVFGSELDRRSTLIGKIRGHDASPKNDADCEKQAISLIDTDSNQIDDEDGQRIAEVFHLGDVFVDGIDATEADKTIRRFICAFFGNNGSSPNKDEYGMYAAAAASYRSIDLSRQVGAAIFSKAAEVISQGCNEVPKPKGGTYWSDDCAPTFRDFDRRRDANQERRDEILHDLVGRMSEEKLLAEQPKKPSEIQFYVQRLLKRKKIADSQLMDIIEFGRMIHAEMSAISDAARLGRSTKDGTLYTTTFPCHLCAKHIEAAGIDRVVFLEPYPKSYAKKLHDDSITFDPKEKSKVLFQPFIGVSPRRYRDIFEKKKRKIGETIVDWYEGDPAPRVEDRSSSYIENEAGLAYYALGELYRR
jgi:deoxycytidylate deaminase